MKQYFEKAVKNIAEFGDTDIFQFPFENHIFKDQPEAVVKELGKIHKDFFQCIESSPPSFTNAIVPLSNTSFRWATQIDPLWNAYYLALVISLAEAFEKRRVPKEDMTVFSYRYDYDPEKGSLWDREVNWKSFTNQSLALSKSKEFKYVVVADISDFYTKIYHHRVDNFMRRLHRKEPLPSRDTPNRIIKFLTKFSGGNSYGLPVGGPASRLLAELSLWDVDDSMSRAGGVKFCRYVDDYRMFCSSEKDAYALLYKLSDKLYKEGLSLQKHKTRIMSCREFQGEFKFLSAKYEMTNIETSDEEKLANVMLQFDPYADISVEDQEKIRDAVADVDLPGILAAQSEKIEIDRHVTNQAFRALKHADKQKREEALRFVFTDDHISDYSTVLRPLLFVVRDIIRDLSEDLQKTIARVLMDYIEQEHYLFLSDLNLSFAIRIIGSSPVNSREKEELMENLYTNRRSSLVRREVIRVMANWEAEYWIRDIRADFPSLNEWEKRMFALASYRLGDEGKHWRRGNKKELQPLGIISINWYKERMEEIGGGIP